MELYKKIKDLPNEGCMVVQIIERNKFLQTELLSRNYLWNERSVNGVPRNCDKRIICWSKDKTIFWVHSLDDCILDEVKFEDHFIENKEIVVEIKLFFGNHGEHAQMVTNDIPLSLILEKLQTLSKGLARQIIDAAKPEVEPEDLTAFLDGVVITDREILRLMLE